MEASSALQVGFTAPTREGLVEPGRYSMLALDLYVRLRSLSWTRHPATTHAQRGGPANPRLAATAADHVHKSTALTAGATIELFPCPSIGEIQLRCPNSQPPAQEKKVFIEAASRPAIFRI